MNSGMRICDNVAIALGDDFLASDKPSEIGPIFLASAIEATEEEFELDEFDQLIVDTMQSFDQYDTAMDEYMAVRLHQSLPISRRQAADARFWVWLGVEHCPDFVAYRWKPKPNKEERNAERFAGSRVRQAFARLWWAVELTRDGVDYSLTTKLFQLSGFQDLYEAIFGRAFGNYRPAMQAFVDNVGGRDEDFIRDFCKQLGYVLSTTSLETMSEAEIANLIDQLIGKMEEHAA